MVGVVRIFKTKMMFLNKLFGKSTANQEPSNDNMAPYSEKTMRGLSVFGKMVSFSGNDSYKVGNNCVVLSSKTPLLSTDVVGGKAHNLIKLFRMGVPVPESCVLTCDEYEQGQGRATLSEFSKEVLTRFLDRNARYAVRSSASCEDGADSAYAGRFRTELNVPGNLEAISEAVFSCWSSMKAPDLVDKLVSQKARMGVVIMRQIDSKRAGVLFQANPVTGSRATHVITAAYGQGEGVVGGKVAVDTYSLKESTLDIKAKDVSKKTRKMSLNPEQGVLEVDVPVELQDVQCLTDDEIKQVAKVGKTIRQHCNSPQDVEFCFDEKNKLYILQTRPITTLAETLEWKPPEPGLFQLNGHLATPMSEFYGPCWMFGHSKGALALCTYYGAGVVAVDTVTINGFAYFCMRQPGPRAAPKALPPPFLLRLIIRLTNGQAIRAARAYWNEKKWRKFMEEEYPKRKAAWKTENDEWIKKLENSQSLDDEQFAKLVGEAQAYGGRMYEEHATVTMHNLGPVAYFVMRAMAITKCEAVDGFSCVDGYSDISLGYCGEFPGQIKLISEDASLVAVLSDPALSKDNDTAKQTWTELKAEAKPSPAHKALLEILNTVQYRLAEGYDTANPTLWECPTLVFMGLVDAINKHREGALAKARERSNAEAEAILDKATNGVDRAELESLLTEARLVASLRDERAIFTDLTACGVIHHILLEAGRRLGDRARKNGQEVDDRLILLAKREEIQEYLSDKGAAAPPPSFWKTLADRKIYRETASIMDAPPCLGGVELVPTAEHFPDPLMARSVTSVIFVLDQIFAAPDLELISADKTKAVQNDKNVICGFSGSKGVTRGRARVVLDANDASQLGEGEVCVTKYPSSVINLVLGKASAIVTDLGGVLCHAAICAREAQLPCVIGCHTATSRIKTGDLIEVDGTSGIVRLLTSEEKQ